MATPVSQTPAETIPAPLVERLADPHGVTTDSHEIARELNALYKNRHAIGVRILRDAYLIGLGRLHPNQHAGVLSTAVDDNLVNEAGLADVVNEWGDESSDQLGMKRRLDGPVAQFYQEATGSAYFRP